MNVTQDQFNEAVLAVTGGPDWDIVKQGLSNDIYQIQAGSLDANSWDEVLEGRGFARGLAYLINIREMTIQSMKAEADADV